MINLLADAKKNALAAARVNLILTRYIGITLLAFAFLGGVLFVSYTSLTSIKSNAEAVMKTNGEKTNVSSETGQQINDLSSRLSEASGVLNSEVRYSRLLVALGQALPEGTVLDNLTLSSSMVVGAAPVTLKVYARSMADAEAIQSQLQGTSLFISVVAEPPQESGGIDDYPVVASFNVVFNKAGI